LESTAAWRTARCAILLLLLLLLLLGSRGGRPRPLLPSQGGFCQALCACDTACHAAHLHPAESFQQQPPRVAMSWLLLLPTNP
jgi:hypothetical protein